MCVCVFVVVLHRPIDPVLQLFPLPCQAAASCGAVLGQWGAGGCECVGGSVGRTGSVGSLGRVGSVGSLGIVGRL